MFAIALQTEQSSVKSNESILNKSVYNSDMTFS